MNIRTYSLFKTLANFFLAVMFGVLYQYKQDLIFMMLAILLGAASGYDGFNLISKKRTIFINPPNKIMTFILGATWAVFLVTSLASAYIIPSYILIFSILAGICGTIANVGYIFLNNEGKEKYG